MATPGGAIDRVSHLLLLLHICTGHIQPSQDGIFCLCDYNNSLTCSWNASKLSDRTDFSGDTLCTLYANKRIKSRRLKSQQLQELTRKYSKSCDLKPLDSSQPAVRECSLLFKDDAYLFRNNDEWSIRVHCEPLEHSVLNVTFRLADHIKLNPPGRPRINFTTISWPPGVPKNILIHQYKFHLEWRREAQPWQCKIMPAVSCRPLCDTELRPELLDKGKRYEARVRVQADEKWSKSFWSDWSPVASWESPIGKEKQPDGRGGLEWDTLLATVAGALVTLTLAIVLCKTDRRTWIYMVKKVRGPPLPDPEKFLFRDGNFQFTSESFHSLMKPVIISQVEVTDTVDSISSWAPCAAPPGKRRPDGGLQPSSGSYSQLCPPAVLPLSGGNLEPCTADSPYGPNRGESEGPNGETAEEGGSWGDIDLFKVLSAGGVAGSGTMPVCADYERVEEPQGHCRFGLQSPDSGVCRLVGPQHFNDVEDADTAAHGHHGKQPEGGGGTKEKETAIMLSDVVFGRALSPGSIQVCSDYEQVEMLGELRHSGSRSPDSGVESEGAEQVSQESLEDVEVKSKMFVFSPLLPPFHLVGLEKNSPQMSFPHHLVDGSPFIATSSWGYMPVADTLH